MGNYLLIQASERIVARMETPMAVRGGAQASVHCLDPYIICLAERYPGLAGWVGALGSILALVVALGIFLIQYSLELSSRRVARNRQLDLIEDIVDEIERQLSVSLSDARVGYSRFIESMSQVDTLNSPAFLAASDLACTKIIDWPSKKSYDHFKIYWYNTIRFIENTQIPKMNPTFGKAEIDALWVSVKSQIARRDAALVGLRSALAEVRA